MDGMTMMMRSLGIDPVKIQADFKDLTDGVIKTLEKIEAKLGQIEARQESLSQRMEEIWKANQTALRMTSQVGLVSPLPNPQPSPPLLPGMLQENQ